MYLVKVETIQFRSFVSGDFRRSESRIWNFRRSESEFAPVDALPWVDSEMDSTTQKNEITTQKAQGTTQKTLNTTQKKILNYLKEHPHATRKDMAAVIGDITEDGIKFNIGKLQQYGLLKREGGRKSGTWVVIDNDIFSRNISVSS